MIIDEIVSVLHSNFPDVRIYTETVEQGLKEPCFLISALSTSGSSEHMRRIRMDNQFMIQYFPIPYKVTGKHTENEQCVTMLRNLMLMLAHLNHYHASGLSGSITDNVLNFEVRYPELNIITINPEYMNEYNQNFNEKR